MRGGLSPSHGCTSKECTGWRPKVGSQPMLLAVTAIPYARWLCSVWVLEKFVNFWMQVVAEYFAGYCDNAVRLPVILVAFVWKVSL